MLISENAALVPQTLVWFNATRQQLNSFRGEASLQMRAWKTGRERCRVEQKLMLAT